MDTNFQDKEKVIYYLSVIRDAEIAKPDHEADKELINACVDLLLDLQNKDAYSCRSQDSPMYIQNYIILDFMCQIV